jgi:hypothetical protein
MLSEHGCSGFPRHGRRGQLGELANLGPEFCFSTGSRLTEIKVFVWAEVGGAAEAVSLKWSQARN